MSVYTPYIGIPYERNGRTKDKLDCYGLIVVLYKDLHGIDIPELITPETLSGIQDVIAHESLKWKPCDLEVGCVIVFNVGGYGSHVGYYIGGDRFIHTWEGTGGVTIERLGFAWKHRIAGCYKWN